MTSNDFKAVILDLDGVITRTATQHARAWKQMFDRFLEQRTRREGEDLSPFDIEEDYLSHVDGKPRFDGVRSFLQSRGIDLPEGAPEDPPTADTVHGLGMRKDAIFLELLDREPVEVYDDAAEQLRRWREEGLATALITSSRNGRRIIGATGLRPMFDVMVDGVDAERLGIAGKPAPDIFLHAAKQLGVSPAEAMVIEDARSGVEAGRAGGFRLVVGVARNGGSGLQDAGAHRVVSDLRELADDLQAVAPAASPQRPSALDAMAAILERLEGQRLALFLDYDGTLTPIVRRPEDAVLSESMRTLLRQLASRVTLAIISGRDLADVRKMVALDELYYAGSHGFDVTGPGDLRMQQEAAVDHLPELDDAEDLLRDGLNDIEGAWVERKRFAVAVHFRESAEDDAAGIERAVDDVIRAYPRLRKRGGKKIFELQPDVPWHKGRAVLWLLGQLELDGPDVLAMYVGDDVTDEDAFEALAGRGIGIRVGAADEETQADFWLRDVAELESFCQALLQHLDRGTDGRG
jgi:trehalose-phosphatase